MSLKFIDKQEIINISQLTNIQQKQLEVAGFLYDKKYLPITKRLEKIELIECSEEGGSSFLGNCFLYKVVDTHKHLYDAWLYMADSGTFFNANTTEIIGQVIQFCPYNFQSSIIEGKIKQAIKNDTLF